jgi:putative transposase
MRNQLYIKIGGEDRYWYRAVDKQGNTVDFLLTAKRDARAARRFFTRAVKNSRLLEIVNIDKSGANKAGIREYNAKHGTKVMIRQCKCLNNIVEQDHRAVKRFTRPIQGFKDLRLRGSFWVASSLCTCPQRADARRRERSVRSATMLPTGE